MKVCAERPDRVFIASITYCAFILARAADLRTTLLFSPDLAREGNPFYTFFGGGWMNLLCVFVLQLCLFGSGLVFFVCAPIPPATVPLTFKVFVRERMQQLRRPREPFKTWLPGGRNWVAGSIAIRLFAVALAWGIILGSWAAVCAWYAVAAVDPPITASLFAPVGISGVPISPYIAVLVGFTFGAMLFFWSEFTSVRYRVRVE